MKKILIIGRQDDRPNQDTPERFHEQIKDYLSDEYQLFYSHYESLIFELSTDNFAITDTENDVNLKAYDVVFMIAWFKHFNEHAFVIGEYLQKHNVTFYNSEVIHNRAKGKLGQYARFQKHELPIIPTVAASFKLLKPRLQENQTFDYPYILKGAVAWKGRDNHLIESRKQLNDVTSAAADAMFMAQQFIPNDGDLRVLVFNGSVPFAIHRTAVTGSHLNNTSQGATAKIVDSKDLPKEVVDISLAAAKQMNREIAGVDMVQDSKTKNWYILEVNNLPQIATGSFTTEKIQALLEAISS